MKKETKLFASLALTAALTVSCTGIVGAEAPKNLTPAQWIKTVNSDWAEVSDPSTIHTFTDGTDRITIRSYGDYYDLPDPARVKDPYSSVYQVFYTAGDCTYVITGYAVQKEDASNLIKIISSLSESDILTFESPAAYTPKYSDSSYEDEYQENTPTSSEQNKDASDAEEPDPSEDSEDDMYEADPPEEEPVLDTDDVSQEDDIISQINDPFDLYSWDPGTNQYIPFQQAEGEGLPIGRGSGVWYYYDSNRNIFIPW